MKMSDTIIKIDHVSKEYRLGAIGGGTLKGDLQSAWARFRKKEDPNGKIGEKVNIGERFLALDDVSFEVKKGEALGIIGHNGAGKSTLLKLLSRVTAPTKGTISYNGRIASMLEVGTGFHPELTGRENVYLNGAILGMTKAEIDRKFDQIVEFAEMEKFIDTPVKRYSSGMYVKLAFAVAAHLDSEIMVMDEVLAVGDMKFQQKCLGRMDDAANNEGRTVLYVSHNMNTIRQLCTRCVVLDHGKVAFDGGVEDGMGVYMEKNDCIPQTHYVYTDEQRADIRKCDIKLLGAEILNRNGYLIQRGEPLEFILACEASETIQNAKVRFEVFYQDDTIVGTSISDKTFSVQKGIKTYLHMSFPTDNFVSGKYKVTALVYKKNDFGTQDFFDRVVSAIMFEIVEIAPELDWLHQYWGHIRLDDIHLLEVKNKENMDRV